MTKNNKIGIIVDRDFATKHAPPYPHPIFLSYETPQRIAAILSFLEENNVFMNEKVIKIKPTLVDESLLNLAHSRYLIESVRNFSNRGFGLLSEEIFITEDTFELAKKAVGGTMQAINSVLNDNVDQSFALIRPPGHHALREKASGLCIFNNIANSIIHLRENQHYNKKIAIVDIDAHFGDGLVQYFYDDPSVLYFSVHEFDFAEGDIGFIDELGEGEGLGTNINFPLPMGSGEEEFLECLDILNPILKAFQPDLIIVAAGFDMHYSDPIGNCNLTSNSYYKFAKEILKIAGELCEGKLAFILEGGYSIIALPYCVHAVIKALLNEDYKQPIIEKFKTPSGTKNEEVEKIKSSLLELLTEYWNL